MLNKLDWVFEERHPEESAAGDDVSGRVLRSNKLEELAILGREGGQNTLNQPLDEKFETPVNVQIKLIELTGSYKEEYLNHLQWESLKKHIEASAKRSEQQSSALQLKKSLEEINDKRKSLFILNIEDSNCYGLTGPEGEAEDIEKPNFFNLCKATFYTSETPQSTRGGSFGVGKSILWNCSKISTVIFSSLVDKNEKEKTQGGLRVFGRTSLPSHNFGDEHFRGPGYFGSPVEVKDKKNQTLQMAHSVWNNHKLAKDLFIDRDLTKKTGATISIVGFDENKAKDYGLEGHEMLIGIKKQFEKYFWPALAIFPKKLNLSFVFQRNLKIREEYNEQLKIDLKEWQNFIDAANIAVDSKELKDIANKENYISKKLFNIKLPPRKILIPELDEKIKDYTNTNFELSIKRGGKEEIKNSEANKVALVRGFGMVVDYRRPETASLSSTLPFFGVAKVGKLLGVGKKEIISETFFKDHEPELHDRWDAKVKGIENKYNKSAKTISEFFDLVDSGLLKMCGEEETEGNKGPELLSNMLNMGFKGGEKTEYRISSENIKAIPITKYTWSVSGIITISDYPKSEEAKINKSWEVGFGFSVKEETSRGDKLPFKKIECIGENIEIIFKDKGIRLRVTDSKQFSFNGELDLKDFLLGQNPKFCAINFYTG
jgi:RNA polymerase primary sigma factor